MSFGNLVNHRLECLIYSKKTKSKGIPIKCFVSYLSVSCHGGSVARAQGKEWTLEGVWIPKNAGLLSKKAWLQSQLENVIFSFVIPYLSQENVQSVFQFTFAQ